MNWLDPSEVEAWLTDPPKAERRHCWYALEQFVRALDSRSRTGNEIPWALIPGSEETMRILMVARLLVKAMEEK